MIADKTAGGSVLLVDALQLRRIQTTAWLTGWAKENALELISMAPEGVSESFDDIEDCRLVIFAVGGVSLADAGFIRQMRVLNALWADIPFIIFSDRNDAGEVAISLECGALGFFPSCLDPELALQALSFILHGGSYFPPSAVRGLPGRKRLSESSGGGSSGPGSSPKSPDDSRQGNGKPTRQLDSLLYKTEIITDYSPDQDSGNVNHLGLTDRQYEVLVCLREGQPNKVIARTLGITEATAKIHVREIMRRLGVSNRTQAALCRFTTEGKEPCTSPVMEDCQT